MSYQVIARKYRPAKFADITAQEHVTRTIQNSLRMGRVGAWLHFFGIAWSRQDNSRKGICQGVELPENDGGPGIP